MDTIARGLQGLVRERRDDWSRWREEQAAQRTESDQRFNNMLEDARADRQRMAEQAKAMADQAAANETEHRAIRENIQALLAEIARIWLRLQAS